jgi:hypothetical protein
MDWDWHIEPVKNERIKISTKQDTPQEKERLKITPLIQENQDKEQHRRATTSHRKSIPKEHDWDYREWEHEGALEDCGDEEACCKYFRAALRHRFTSPDECMAEWMSIQQNNTQYCVNQRTVITSECSLDLYNEGNGGFASKPTLLKALKRALQEMPGTDRWYGTMPKECMTIWIMETTGLEEVIDTEVMEVKKTKTEGNEKRKKTKERAEKEGKERETIRRRTKAREIAYYIYINEAEYYLYLEERERHEEQYDDEQCAYYHRSYIEEALNDICKRLYLRSQPTRTARHSRWEKEMQLRREQKEEQATEAEITIYETEQQQEQKIKQGRQEKEGDHET